jgi:hypothetical protein
MPSFSCKAVSSHGFDAAIFGNLCFYLLSVLCYARYRLGGFQISIPLVLLAFTLASFYSKLFYIFLVSSMES